MTTNPAHSSKLFSHAKQLFEFTNKYRSRITRRDHDGRGCCTRTEGVQQNDQTATGVGKSSAEMKFTKAESSSNEAESSVNESDVSSHRVNRSSSMKKKDEADSMGVSLARELMTMAGNALKTNITTLGPLVLPLLGQFKFLLSSLRRKMLKTRLKPFIPDFELVFGRFCMHAGDGGEDYVEMLIHSSAAMTRECSSSQSPKGVAANDWGRQ